MDIYDVIAMVEALDLLEEDFAAAVNSQARLMAGLDLEPRTDIAITNPYSALRF